MSCKTAAMKLKAVIHEAEEGGYWAEVPALPGCVTQGETVEEVTLNLRDAIVGWLSVETPEGEALQRDRVIELAL
jgi:predicted RNase H-like HicB family nuclease